MREWRVIVKTEKVVRCMPDVLYIKNNDGILLRIEATKIREDGCEYNLPQSNDNPEIYILVLPSDVQVAYIVCNIDRDTIYEKLVSYGEIPYVLNEEISKLITKHLYKE